VSEPPLLSRSHTPEAIAARLAVGPRRSYLRDFVYGAIDGTVTTFAVVAGVRGASLAASVVVILGIANLAADGFSMAASNFLGIRAEEQHQARIRRQELEHIARVPEGEREEVRQIFAAKGLTGDALDQVVAAITAQPTTWVDTMLVEEHGFARQGSIPLRSAAATFVAFVGVGFVPVAPYVVDVVSNEALPAPFALSMVLTAVAFVVVGIARATIVEIARWRGAVETLALGGAAALLAFAVGSGLQALV
jgi:VIT1/CCC1 family predicted Fe2+/Mn2+ transporter